MMELLQHVMLQQPRFFVIHFCQPREEKKREEKLRAA